jgi:O-methyltransferase involved in polyketide biosynthesis
MQQDKVKAELSGTQASMLVCLWGRAQLSKKYRQLFNDEKAIELVEKIDYDFSTIQSDIPFEDIVSNISLEGGLPLLSLFTLRAKQFDNKVKAYIGEHPQASVVNIGAGLDTTFYRIDNGAIHWYDLDLPAVIDIRRQLLPEPDRVTYIAQSLLDPSWCEDVNTENGVFMLAGGVLGWLEEAQAKQFFSMLADNFPDGEIVFNFRSRSDDNVDAWIAQFPPEQRGAVRAAWMEALKNWWEKAPQDQKDKLNDMVAALKIPTKPRGKEWSDFEAWWNQLIDEDKDEVIADSFFRGGVGRWTLEDASEFTKWDSRITVIDQLPMFKNIPRDSVSAEIRKFMDYSDERGKSSIIHLRV